MHTTCSTVGSLWRQNITKVILNKTPGYIIQLSCGSFLFVDANTESMTKIASNQRVSYTDRANTQRPKL